MCSHEMEDILLTLLVYNVDNKDAWIGIELLKMKVGMEDEEMNEAIKNLADRGYIEFRDEEHLKITKEGIDFIVSRV
ncbi:MAG: hypothetical protein J7K61_02220 [Thermoplasmata archaeon]|nr:hypothetical protein [Thermoplasmata archaeon]